MIKPLKNLREEAAQWLIDRAPKTPGAASTPGMVAGAAAQVEIEVRDFGPIAEGKVEMRPLTVFAGPSNMGKSWMATLIYVLERYRKQLHDYLHYMSGTFMEQPRREGLLSDERIAKVPENIRQWRDDLYEQGRLSLTKPETAAFRGIIESVCASVLSDELLRCYSLESVGLIRRDQKKASIRFNILDACHDFNMSVKSGGKPGYPHCGSLKIALPETAEVSFGGRTDRMRHMVKAVTENSRDGTEDEYLNKIRLLSLGAFSEQIVKAPMEAHSANPNAGVYYLPAGRGGIMETHAALVGALIQNASRAGIRNDLSVPALTGVAADFLNVLLKLAQRDASQLNDGIPNQVEAKILRGQVRIKQPAVGVAYPVFVYQPENWGGDSIRMHNASSMVAELSPLPLLLNHVLEPGDTLILDEPEAHLHPAAQTLLVEEVVSWIKDGIKVVLTTHSGWILDGISNMVARGEVKDSQRGDIAAINKDDVGVWLFAPVDAGNPGKGARVQEALWDRERGGYEAGFYGVSIEMHNDWAGSINRLNGEDDAE